MDDKILRRIAEYMESGQMERDSARMETELRETVALAGFDPATGDGATLLGHLHKSFMYEDLENGKRPVRLAQAIALGMGHDIEVNTCDCGCV